MGFKKLFRKDDEAVSPVIGVILMVAITVILAAAIGSSVFSHGTAKSAPQANFNIRGIFENTTPVSIFVEHVGGDTVHFEDTSITKVVAVIDGTSHVIDSGDNAGTTDVEGLGTMDVGDSKKLKLVPAAGEAALPAIEPGDTVNIKFIDAQTNQLICDKDVRF